MTGEGDGDRLARGGGAPNGELQILLQDHVITEYRGHCDIGTGCGAAESECAGGQYPCKIRHTP